MAIETRLHQRQTLWHFFYIVVCVGFALYGWYDYSIAYPAQDAAYAEYKALKDRSDELAKKGRESLTQDELKELSTTDSALAKYIEVPSPRSALDYQVQIWLYMVGCGLSAPMFLWMHLQARKRRYRLDDDGTLHTPEGSFASDQIVGIDLSKWMDKWIAKVKVADGRTIALDDYKYQFTEDIVGVFAQRFEPGKWTSDARPIGDPKSRDTKKALAEAEQAAENDGAGR
jgi:hypothetical protein